MEYWRALAEWESGGISSPDIEDENLCEFLDDIIKELKQRGFSFNCEEYEISGVNRYSVESKIISFDGKA